MRPTRMMQLPLFVTSAAGRVRLLPARRLTQRVRSTPGLLRHTAQRLQKV